MVLVPLFFNNVVEDRKREVVVGPGNSSMITLEVRAGLGVLLIQSSSSLGLASCNTPLINDM